MSTNRGRINRETANRMRERGLAVRRLNAELRRMKQSEQGLSAKPMQPTDPPVSKVSELSPAEASLPTPGTEAPGPHARPTDNAPAVVSHAGQERRYGYELAPGVFMEHCTPPANGVAEPGTTNQIGLLQAQRLLAQKRRAQMLRAHSQAARA